MKKYNLHVTEFKIKNVADSWKKWQFCGQGTIQDRGTILDLPFLHVTLVTFGNFLFGILFDDFWTLPSQPHTANKYRKAPKVITFKYQFSSLEKCSI